MIYDMSIDAIYMITSYLTLGWAVVGHVHFPHYCYRITGKSSPPHYTPPLIGSFEVSLELTLHKLLTKPLSDQWLAMTLMWRHCNAWRINFVIIAVMRSWVDEGGIWRNYFCLSFSFIFAEINENVLKRSFAIYPVRNIPVVPWDARRMGSIKKKSATSCPTSNGSWCMGIKGEMSGTVCVTFTWYMYIYELFIAFVCFVVCSLL